MKTNMQRRFLFLLGKLLLVAAVLPLYLSGQTTDTRAGLIVFREKGCASCHAVLGEGGVLGPDLTRTASTGNPLELAAAMWGHAPQMWQRMKLEHLELPTFTTEEMENMFAFLAMIRSFDEPGNAVVGQQVFQAKQCATCHSIGGQGGNLGPNLTTVASLRNPVAWVAGMWNHGPGMVRALRERGISFPEFQGTEMVDLQSYIRLQAGAAADEKTYLRPPSTERGESLFRSKQCINCHGIDSGGGTSGPDMSRVVLPRRFGEIATVMWNHEPQMNRLAAAASISYPQLEAQELADILSFLNSLSMRWTGSASAGAKLFESKGCVNCHATTPGQQSPAPNLGKIEQSLTPITVSTIMWNHGPRMLEQMENTSMTWPVLTSRELADMIVYLESLKGRGQRPVRSPSSGGTP